MTFSEFLAMDFRVFSVRITGVVYEPNSISFEDGTGFVSHRVADNAPPIMLVNGNAVREITTQYPLDAIASWGKEA